ncbi:class I SAM-dependent methyltransferase [Chloroflexota bacterium]
MVNFKEIKAFLQSHIDEIEAGGDGVNGLLRNKSNRCVEIPWIILNFLRVQNNPERILDTGISFFDRVYFNLFLNTVISPSREFHAIDIIPFKPERFFKRANKEPLEKIRFKQGDIRCMPYIDSFFDIVFCISTIEHIGFDMVNLNNAKSSFDRPGKIPEAFPSTKSWDEDLKSMKEITRVLKPGGTLFLTVPFGKEEIIAEKDSLGLYALELQYDETRLAKITSLPGINIVQKQIFTYDKVGGWDDKILSSITSRKSAVACLEIEKAKAGNQL